jgi:hypothetical protein
MKTGAFDHEATTSRLHQPLDLALGQVFTHCKPDLAPGAGALVV